MFEGEPGAGAEVPGAEDAVPWEADGVAPAVPGAEGDLAELGEAGFCGEEDPVEAEVLGEEGFDADGLDEDEGLGVEGEDGLDVGGGLGIDVLEALLELWLWLCCTVLQAASESSADIAISNADRFSISLMAASVESLRNVRIFSNNS